MEKNKLLVLAVLKPKNPYYDFAVQELKSLLEMAGIDAVGAFAVEYLLQKKPLPSAFRDIKKEQLERQHFVRLEIPVDQVPLLQTVIDRSVMVLTFIKLIGNAKDTEELISKIDLSEFQSEVDSEETFSFKVTASFKSLKFDEQAKEREKFSQFNWKGKANMKEPKRVFWLIHGWHFVEQNGTSFLEQVYFGKEVVQTPMDEKTFNGKYILSKRLYLGPTSTDHELSFLMVNQGRVKPGDLVLDPFAGTGSILIAAAHLGGICYGTDIDYRVIRGKGVGRKNKQCDLAESVEHVNIFSNFVQYGLEKPEIFRMDCTNDMFKSEGFFDAIVCDPPYGIRAGAKECGLREARVKRKEEREVAPSDQQQIGEKPEEAKDKVTFLPTKTTDMDTTVVGLLQLATRVLKRGGLLVFLFHIFKEQKFEEVFPWNPNFELIDASENVLGKEHSRLLITMVKK